MPTSYLFKLNTTVITNKALLIHIFLIRAFALVSQNQQGETCRNSCLSLSLCFAVSAVAPLLSVKLNESERSVHNPKKEAGLETKLSDLFCLSINQSHLLHHHTHPLMTHTFHHLTTYTPTCMWGPTVIICQNI